MSDPDARDLIAFRVENTWRILGNTYDHKEWFKSFGMGWDPRLKAWTWDGDLPNSIENVVMIVRVTDGEDLPPEPAPPSGDPGQPQVIEKTVRVEINRARPRRGQNRRRCGVGRHIRLEIPDIKLTETFIKPQYWDDLMLYLLPGEARPVIALVGPAGNGKTTAAEAVLKALNYDYSVIDATEYIEPADLIGGKTYHPKEGEVWRDGKVTQAFRSGKAVIINEFDALNPRAGLCMQSVFQDAGVEKKGRYITLVEHPTEDRVYPAKDCPVILTMNTYGTGATRQYVGRNALDAANLDRITLISTTYEHEAEIIVAHGYGARTGERLAIWAQQMRVKIETHGLKVILSNRTLLRMAQGMERYGWSFEIAQEKEFFGRLEEDTRSLLYFGKAGKRHAS